MRGFVRVGASYVAEMDDVERVIIAGVVADTAGLLGTFWDPDGTGGPAEADPLTAQDWASEHVEAPSDPALARLLPPATTDDEQLAAEFRRLTEGSLRRRKVANLHRLWTALRGPAGPLAVPRAEAEGWAAALTDVRLVLASRLGIETDADADRVHDAVAAHEGGEEDVEAEVEAALSALYTALTWLQESLVQAMLEDRTGRGRRRARVDPGH